MASRVVIIPCSTYEEQKVYEVMETGINVLGGIERFVKKEEKVLVKPNFLLVSEVESAAVTHPAVIKGMLRILSEHGYGDVSFGDSPGHGTCKAAAEKIGLTPENTFGAKLAPMSEEVTVQFPEGMTCKEFHFCKEIVESDAVIELCKMKTHALERITGAVKNAYGFICGYRKAAGHVKYPNASVFARALADIHRYVKPRLYIMDGITAMEGNGPGAGTPTPMNVMLFSTDPVALDATFARLVALDPTLVPTNVQGSEMGIGTYRDSEIEIIDAGSGKLELITSEEMFRRYGNEKFDVGREKPKQSLLLRFSSFMTHFSRRPYIDKKACVKCGICVLHCPVPGKAVDFKNGKDNPPVHDYKKCIRCYCCQEMCPKHAIHVKGRD